MALLPTHLRALSCSRHIYRFITLVVIIVSFIPQVQAESLPDASSITEARTQTFVVTAYYSPVVGQKRYMLGSYEDDIRLNGRGTHGASGEGVFPGMIAAPRNYAFGQYIDLSGFGIGKISDRGGAITSASGSTPDRLDIWMGHGDAGLTRALTWGRKTVTGTIYPLKTSLKTNIDFKLLYPQISDTPIIIDYEEQKRQEAAKGAFEKRINLINEQVNALDGVKIGSNGAPVIQLQKMLLGLGYLKEIPKKDQGRVSGTTRVALIRLQKDHQLIKGDRDSSAGIVGPRTRSLLKTKLKNSDIDLTNTTSTQSTHTFTLSDDAPIR